jgi:hypothetical protein
MTDENPAPESTDDVDVHSLRHAEPAEKNLEPAADVEAHSFRTTEMKYEPTEKKY